MNIEYNEVSVSASDDLTFDRSCSIYLYVMILCIRDIMVPSSCFTNNNDMTFLFGSLLSDIVIAKHH